MRIVSGIVEKQVLQSDKTKAENAESSFSLMYTSVPYWSIFYYSELMGKKNKNKTNGSAVQYFKFLYQCNMKK